MPDAQTDAWNTWGNSLLKSGATGNFTAGSNIVSASGPAYERVASIPGWLPPLNTRESSQTYADLGKTFDTTSFDRESKGQENRIMSSALSAGNNAAAEYANRARQQGGSTLGAGLVKAETSIAARKSAGELALDREKFDAGQREKAATLAGQIAQTLGGLRSDYLKSIVSYATQEDSISADYAAKMAGIDASGAGKRGNEPTPPNSFTPGYVPTFGPITQATVNNQTVPNSAFGSTPTSWWPNYGRG